jgi:hypothetical protein
VLIRPFHSGLSRVMRISAYMEKHDMSFDAEPMIEKYGIEPVRLRDWVVKNAIV